MLFRRWRSRTLSGRRPSRKGIFGSSWYRIFRTVRSARRAAATAGAAAAASRRFVCARRSSCGETSPTCMATSSWPPPTRKVRNSARRAVLGGYTSTYTTRWMCLRNRQRRARARTSASPTPRCASASCTTTPVPRSSRWLRTSLRTPLAPRATRYIGGASAIARMRGRALMHERGGIFSPSSAPRCASTGRSCIARATPCTAAGLRQRSRGTPSCPRAEGTWKGRRRSGRWRGQRSRLRMTWCART